MEERVQQVGRPQRAKVFQLPPETRVIEVFTREEIAGRLLILGEPGSGKTITLLQLAQELIEQAERNSTAQVPVIFELSTWKSDKQSLEQWLVAQLKDIYSIDQKVSQKWLENERILPLLDGLDELGLPRQRLAIQAINQYLQQDLSRRLVVCCRWEEYRRGKKKLHQLHGAYYLQPPSDSVIRDYLQSFGQQQLWSKIDSNPLMKELAQKPLFLNLMIPAFKGEEILSEEKLFENYIAWQLNPDNHDPRKYPQGVPYTEENTKHWLSYLARHLSADSLTVFLIEKMQCYWLSKGGERLAFRLIFGLIFGLSYGLIGLIFGLFLGLIGLSYGLFLGLIFGLSYGLIGLSYGLFFWDFEEYEIQGEAFTLSWERLSYGLFLGLFFGLSYGLFERLSYGLFERLSYGLFERLSYGLFLGLFERLSYGLFLGLIFGLIYGLSCGLIYGLKTEIKTREIPNQGIKEAWKKSLIIPFFTFPLCVLILPLTSLATGVTFSWQRYIGVGLAVAMITSLVTGGEDWIQHLALRLILWLRRKIPWDYARFLDYAAERRLLQKTGGRYRFFHDSLRKYFCDHTPLPSHTVEITKSKLVGLVLILFTIFNLVIFSNSIYPVYLTRASLLAPIVQTNDVTLSDIITYRWRNYQRGDVIEFWIDEELARQGFNPYLNYIMRIVGLPGEIFEIQQGQVYINGQILSADYLDNLPIENYDQVKIEIPADLYLVMGKNVAQEEESLVASLVYKEQILNRIIFRLWPPERWGRVK